MQAKQLYVSYEEYLKLDQEAPEGVRMEWFDGTIYINGASYDPYEGRQRAIDMAGATPAHNRIVSNLARVLGNQLLEKRCDVFIADQYTQYMPGRHLYPDVVVSCGSSFDGVMLTNPLLTIEVLSPGSVDHDTGRKKAAYMRIASLQEYWIIAQAEVRLQRYYRDRPWSFRHYDDLQDTVSSELLELAIPLREIYRLVFE